MKCAEFSEIVSDLARNEGLEQAVRQRAMLHADACPRCDEELVMARTLSAALHALAASTTAATAPARVEEILRGEMRQRRKAVAMPAPRARRWAIAGVAGLAAAALISIAFLKPEIFHPRGVTSPAALTQTAGATAQGSEATAQVAPASAGANASAAPGASPQSGGNSAANNFGGTGAARPVSQQDSDTEYATAYVALPSAEGATFAEDQTIVRVSLPPSALASFGFPVRAEGGDSNVLADFVLGEDGTPRAVRLVQQ